MNKLLIRAQIKTTVIDYPLPVPCSTRLLAYAELKEPAFHLPNFEPNA